jgi:hypothetical protein
MRGALGEPLCDLDRLREARVLGGVPALRTTVANRAMSDARLRHGATIASMMCQTPIIPMSSWSMMWQWTIAIPA